MLKVDKQALLRDTHVDIRGIYNKYAGMLLGYIFEIVKDHDLAEEYLVRIFNDLNKQFSEVDWDDTNTWCQLLRFAKKVLAEYHMASRNCAPRSPAVLVVHNTRHENFNHLNDEQKKVFCDVYYNGKGITEISTELNQTEAVIRKTLKEAFAIIRKGD